MREVECRRVSEELRDAFGLWRTAKADSPVPLLKILGTVGELELGALEGLGSGKIQRVDVGLRKVVREQPGGVASVCAELEDRVTLEQ